MSVNKFAAIQVGLASPNESANGPMAKSKSRKRLTTVLKNLNGTAYSANGFSVLPRTGNVIAENTRKYAIKA